MILDEYWSYGSCLDLLTVDVEGQPLDEDGERERAEPPRAYTSSPTRGRSGSTLGAAEAAQTEELTARYHWLLTTCGGLFWIT